MTRRRLGVAFALLLIAGTKSAVAQSNIRNISTESELVDAVANPTVPGSPSLDTLALQNSLFLTAPIMLPLGTGPTFQVGNGLLLQGAFTGLSTLRKRGAGTLYLMSPFNSPFGIQAFEGTVELAPGRYSKIEVAGTLRARGPTIITSLEASGATMDTGWSVVVADTFSGRLVKVGSGNLVIFSRTPRATDDEIDVREGTLTLRTGERLRLTLDGGTLRTGPTEIENIVTLGAAGGTFDTSEVLFLTGGVTGPGRLVKSGAGVLLLAGPSTYTGGTTGTGGLAPGRRGEPDRRHSQRRDGGLRPARRRHVRRSHHRHGTGVQARKRRADGERRAVTRRRHDRARRHTAGELRREPWRRGRRADACRRSAAGRRHLFAVPRDCSSDQVAARSTPRSSPWHSAGSLVPAVSPRPGRARSCCSPLPTTPVERSCRPGHSRDRRPRCRDTSRTSARWSSIRRRTSRSAA